MLLRLLTAVTLSILTLGAQDPEPPPRLGLVLSGGGARGFAHVGVLQVLEEMRIPVDCVAGTSMGAIIGGLYAYGLDPYEIERIVNTLDWDYVLQDFPRRTDLAIRRKQEEYEFLIQLRVGFRDGGFALPKGLVQGQNLGVVLDQLTLEAHELATFDELALPFRCVAADIGDGTRVVFDRGDLPRAMRASMALPAIFAPVEWQGRLLVDGGIIDNLPVEAARGMGATRLIAVDIGTPPLSKEQIKDLFGITSQMVSLLTQKYVDEAIKSLTAQDLLLQPQLGDLTSADFKRGPELIALGREYALRAADALQRFSVSEAEFEAWCQRHRRQVRPPPIVTEIDVVANEASERAHAASRLTQQVGQPLDLPLLKRDVERIYGLDHYELVRCRVRFAGKDRCVLEVQLVEKSWGPGFLRFGMDAGSDFNGDDAFSVSTRFVQPGIGSLGAEWATTVRLGTDTLLETEWFQPLDLERNLFIAPLVSYRRRPLRALVPGQVVELTAEEAVASLDIGTHTLPWTEFRFGIDRIYDNLEVTAGFPGSGDIDDAGLHARFEFDTLDRPTFPTGGVRAMAGWRQSMEELGSDSSSTVARFEGMGVAQWGGQNFALYLSGQWELSGSVNFTDGYELGGLFRLSGIGGTTIVAREGGLATLVTYRRLSGTQSALSFPVYLGGSLEVGGVWDWSSVGYDDLILSGSVFTGMDSPLGPVLVALGFTETGERAAYFSVGRFIF